VTTREAVEGHLDAYVAVARRWQRAGEAAGHGGGLPCPVARIPLQWPEFFSLPVAVDAAARRGDAENAALAHGLVDFLARVQHRDGTFDAGFCGDLCQPCNAAFALRPLAAALHAWPAALDAARRARLADVVARAADACRSGGMTTPNHRWVAAGGLAHAASVLDRDDLREAAADWVRGGIDVDADGAYSEGSPKYALVSDDMLLDLEALLGRTDLGDVARGTRAYLRSVSLPDGDLALVASTRYDTEGSTDGYARAACVFARLGDPDLARRALARLWRARTAPGLVAACAVPPLGAVPKAKLYPSLASALTAEHLLRGLREGFLDGVLDAPEPAPGAERQDLAASGLATWRRGGLAVLSGRGPNLLEVHWGGVHVEGVRLVGHASGWNTLWCTSRRVTERGVELALSAAPGSETVRLPQFHRAAPTERRPGNAVPALRGTLRVAFGPGPEVTLEAELDGVAGANALLEVAARPDAAIFDADGVRRDPPFAVAPAGRSTLAGPGAERLVLDHEGGSGHALQVAPYGYGDGDARWAPSFAPASLRYGVTLPARLSVRIAAV